MADEMTLQEIADQFDCSRQNIEQILRGIFRKVRRKLRNRGIHTYSDIAVEGLIGEAIRTEKRPTE